MEAAEAAQASGEVVVMRRRRSRPEARPGKVAAGDDRRSRKGKPIGGDLFGEAQALLGD